jgi:hypothetical protein
MMNCSDARRQRRLVLWLTAAALFEGLRAGAGTFRLLLDLPARRRIGAVAFAEFSRATDLSTKGVVFYTVYGFGGVLLTAAAWWAATRCAASRRLRLLLALACSCSIAVLLFTTQAAPLMWRVGSAPSDPVVLSALFDRFAFWTELRIVCVDVSFICVLAALALPLLDASALHVAARQRAVAGPQR